MPIIHLSPFSPPCKKLRLPQHSDFPLNGQIPLSIFPGNTILGSSIPFSCLPDNTPAGMQGARHAQYGLSSPLSDFHLKKLQSGLFPVDFERPIAPTGASIPVIPGVIPKPGSTESISCLLTMGNSTQALKKTDVGKVAPFVLFGQPILTEKQMSMSCSSDTVSLIRTGNSSSDGNAHKTGNTSDGSGSALNQNDAPERTSCERFQSELNLETGHCKVFMESENVGRILDLSLVASYEELYTKLANMFGVEISEMLNRILYRDVGGAVRQLGEEPFSNFTNTTRRLTILGNLSSDNVGV